MTNTARFDTLHIVIVSAQNTSSLPTTSAQPTITDVSKMQSLTLGSAIPTLPSQFPILQLLYQLSRYRHCLYKFVSKPFKLVFLPGAAQFQESAFCWFGVLTRIDGPLMVGTPPRFGEHPRVSAQPRITSLLGMLHPVDGPISSFARILLRGYYDFPYLDSRSGHGFSSRRELPDNCHGG